MMRASSIVSGSTSFFKRCNIIVQSFSWVAYQVLYIEFGLVPVFLFCGFLTDSGVD